MCEGSSLTVATVFLRSNYETRCEDRCRDPMGTARDTPSKKTWPKVCRFLACLYTPGRYVLTALNLLT
jgi:hypothetical protein